MNTEQNHEAFEQAYNRIFRGQAINTKKMADCELLWDAAFKYARAALQSQDREDAERLDWLDECNLKRRMGWAVGVAPVGAVSIQSVVTLGRDPTLIREAIDHARRIEGEKNADV